MALGQLKMRPIPKLPDSRMVVAFSGWMDGGNVSTGTVEWLVDTLHAQKVAEIEPEGFYIYNFPGSMEISALFRPHTNIEDGVIKALEFPANTFFRDEKNGLFLFTGKEPNLNWSQFADSIFSFGSLIGISMIYFVGSFGGLVPHTREPRLTTTASNESLRPGLEQYGVKGANYEGPASFATYLLTQASERSFNMASLVAEIPAYIQGTNPKCIEAVVRKLAAVLGLHVSFDQLRSLADAWETRLSDALQSKPELSDFIGKLEESYDNEVFNTQMGDLKEWLEQQGVRVD
jgi:proteasome assembly chaperone (PAC2) family protein